MSKRQKFTTLRKGCLYRTQATTAHYKKPRIQNHDFMLIGLAGVQAVILAGLRLRIVFPFGHSWRR